MAIKNIIAQGIGFSPGSVKYIPTLGFDISQGATLLDQIALTGTLVSTYSLDGVLADVYDLEGRMNPQ